MASKRSGPGRSGPGFHGKRLRPAAVAAGQGWWANTPRRVITPVVTAMAAVLVVAVATSAVVLGWGLWAPAWPLLGLLVCALCTATGWRAGSLLAGVAAIAVLVVAQLGEPPPGVGLPALGVQLATHLLAIAAGLAFGAWVSHLIRREAHNTQAREERLRSLLGLAVDAYWELDHNYRLVAASDQDGARRPLTPLGGLGAVPWDLPRFGCDAETLDELMADLDARQVLRDVPITWARADGRVHTYLVSGEPRFDARGAFKGYWGVARDITAAQAAQDELAATELRYQELFSRIPTPLVLHRDQRVLDANPAALLMFGHDEVHNMVGADFFAPFEGGDSRERARRRAEQLLSQPMGSALPVTDFKLRIGNQQVAVRSTSVRVEADGGPAMLAIFVDDTERLQAEDAVRRSEAMLAHLVATSPDLITLTDLHTGRYAMVNNAFERITGWSAAEAVGRTSLELGLWASDQARENFVSLVEQNGTLVDLPIQFVGKGGVAVPMLVSAARFAMDRRDYVVINARDMTNIERARLEREAILDNVSVGIAVTREGRFVVANPHFERIYGWPKGALVGQGGHVVWASAEDFTKLRHRLSPLLAQGETIETEAPGRRRDGSTFLAHVRGRAIDLERPEDGGTVWLVEDVTERRDFEKTLARARDAAEAASRAKSAFLANTSHELRTPLNGLIGLARLAGMADTPEERRHEYLNRILDSAHALAGIISDILDVSKIESGQLQLEPTHFDLGELLQLLQRTYATLATASGLQLNFDVSDSSKGLCYGDPQRVRQIITNFLANAIKFTAHGHVHLAAFRLGDKVRIEVSDSGPGIDEATRLRLFKPFSQADESTTRRFGGSGLGLAISRELAALMGGDVGVSSPGKDGIGSTFWAEVPLPAAVAPPNEIPEPLATDEPTLNTVPAVFDKTGLEGCRVLLVEDNPVNMLIAAAMLERWGVQVVQAHNGSEAVTAVARAAAADAPFDAVLMDVQMPVMSGYDATRVLRSTDSGHKLPVIALTAAALSTERDEAERAGMSDFLTKPVDADKLHATLMHWCLTPRA